MAWKPHRPGASRDEREGPNGRKGETTVILKGERRQTSAQAELPLQGRGEAPRVERSGEAPSAASRNEHLGNGHRLMERVVEVGNVKAALRRVKRGLCSDAHAR